LITAETSYARERAKARPRRPGIDTRARWGARQHGRWVGGVRAHARTRTRPARRGAAGSTTGNVRRTRRHKTARLKNRRACVGEGGGTCKKAHPSLAQWPASPAAARRRGAFTPTRWPCRPQEGSSNHPHLLGSWPKCSASVKCGGAACQRGGRRSRRRRVVGEEEEVGDVVVPGGSGSSLRRLQSSRRTALPRAAPFLLLPSSPFSSGGTAWLVRGVAPGRLGLGAPLELGGGFK
jgi:hypothetical protein